MIHLQDLVRGTHISRTKDFLEKSDFWDKQQLEQYQLKKFQDLISFSYQHVRYYRRLFDQIGLKPEDISTIDDIRKIPILTKETVREEHEDFIPDNLDSKSYKIKAAKTGGTTGMPLAFYKNTQTRDFTWGAYYRWYNWMGINSSDKEAVLWGDSSVLKKDKIHVIKDCMINCFDHRLQISSFNLNDKTLPLAAEKLIKFRPVLLRGYLSAILQVGKYFKENDLKLPSLKAISSTTETLLPIYRQFIEDAFHVKMFDQYGCGECNSIAFECAAHHGLHVNEEHCLLEVVDDNGNPCTNVSGRILITDLDNYAFPFIRYENGDSAIMGDKECSCGRRSRMLLSIEGRTADVVYLKDGSAVHGVFFTDIFHELGFDNFKYFTRFQIYQETKGDFICRLEKTDNELPSKDLDFIKQTLSRYANHVQIEMLDSLQKDKSGKFRYVISDIKE